jgi:alpha-L-rhamnosidase
MVDRKGHLSTGFVGTPHLMEGLHDFGLEDVSYTLVTQQDYPGWKTLITEGVMKETWQGGLAQMPSLGGSVGQWFYKAVAGIRPDPEGPGFKKIIIKPSLVGSAAKPGSSAEARPASQGSSAEARPAKPDGSPTASLTWAKCSYDSNYGLIVSNWKFEEGRLIMEVAIPPNTTATIHVPAAQAAAVTESGKPAAQAEGVTFLRMEKGAAVYEVGSGMYRFSSKP